MKKIDRRTWMLVCCCGLAAASMGIVYNCAGVFIPYMAEELGTGRGSISAYMTISSLACALTAPMAVRLSRRHDFCRILRITGTAEALAYIGMSGVHSLAAIYVWGVLIGICNGFIYTTMIPIIIGSWYGEKMSVPLSLAYCFSGIAGALFNPLFGRVIQESGWRRAYVVMAIVLFIVMIPAIISLKLAPETDDEVGSDRDKASDPGTSVKVPRYKFILFCLMTAVLAFPFCLGTHFSNLGLSMGLDLSRASYMAAALMAGNLSMKLVQGVLMKRLGPGRGSEIIMSLAVIAGIGLLCLSAESYVFLLLASFLFGAAYSANAVTYAPVLIKLYGTSNYVPRQTVSQSLGTVCAAFFTSLVGYIYDWTGSYRPAILLSIVFEGVSILILELLFCSTRSKASC